MFRLYKGSSFLLLILLYRFVIDFAYDRVISTVFKYEGYKNNFTLQSEFISLVVLLVFSVVVFKIFKNEENEIANEVLLVLFLMSFVPFTSMFGFGAVTLSFVVSNVLFWIFLLFFTLIPIKDIPFKHHDSILLKFGNNKLSGSMQVKILTVLFGLVVLYVSGTYTGFRFNFSLSNVYALRSEAGTFDLPVLLKYLFSWTRTVNAVFIAYYIQKRQWYWAVFCFIIQLLNFGIDGSKTTLFFALFTVAISLVPNFTLQRLNKWIVSGFLGLSFACTVFYIGLSQVISFSIWPVSLFIRRVMFLPVYISSNYFDFFVTHTPDYYRQSFLRFFDFISPYGDISYMIGEVFFKTVTAANNGLISDAITNMGLFGIILAPFLYAVVFRILNHVSRGLDSKLYIAIAIYTTVVLVNTFLLRVLLSHGLLITIMLLSIMPKDTKETMVSNRNQLAQANHNDII